jgi:AcrR family transcriptional regulator
MPGTARWWARRAADPGPRRRPRADGLTLDRILDTALDIVDAEGLEALTMRRLASRLGAGHASLYRHVASHHEVVVLLVDRVLGTLTLDGDDRAPVVATADARTRAEAALRRYRATLLEHPALTPAFLAGQLLGPNALARREEALRMLVEAGMTPELAARAFLTLTHLVISSAAFEASGAGRSAEERAEMRAYFGALPPERYPTLVGMADVINAVDGDDEFELGLTALLDHLEAQAATRA